MRAFDSSRRQTIKTETDIACDMAYTAHLSISAANAVATSANGILAATKLGAAVAEVQANLHSPAVPRALSIVGNVAGITGNVVIEGANYSDDEISETIALNGNATVHGNKAFKTVTSISMPVQTRTPVAQVETVEVTAGSDKISILVVTVTAAGMPNSPKAVNVDVVLADNTVEEVATKIRSALDADSDVGAFFDVGGAGANIVLTAVTPAANDGTMAIALTSAGTSTVTFGASGNTTAGVGYDTVAVGWNDKLGLPYRLSHNTILKTFLNNVLEGTAPTVTVSVTAIESNTIDLNSALNGTAVDTYLMV